MQYTEGAANCLLSVVGANGTSLRTAALVRTRNLQLHAPDAKGWEASRPHHNKGSLCLPAADGKSWCAAVPQVWSVQTGMLLVSARGHTGELADLSLSCDGQLLASGATDGEVRIWSMKVRAQHNTRHSAATAMPTQNRTARHSTAQYTAALHD